MGWKECGWLDCGEPSQWTKNARNAKENLLDNVLDPPSVLHPTDLL